MPEIDYRNTSLPIVFLVEYLLPIIVFVVGFFYAEKYHKKNIELRSTVISARNKQDLEQLELYGLREITEYLGKGKELTPSFFRYSKGPLWVDFAEAFVIERNEITDILNRVHNEQIFLSGGPADGKTTILKSIGYKLTLKGLPVFYYSFKENSSLEQKHKIVKLQQDLGAYFLFDDIHIEKTDAEYFIRYIRERVVFSGRYSKDTSVDKPNVDDKLRKATRIATTESVNINLIDNFRRITSLDISSHVLNKLKNCGNLMHLALYLDNMKDSSGTITALPSIHSQMKKYLDKFRRRSIFEADNILLPIAILYQYETPIRRDFIEVILNLPKGQIYSLAERDRDIIAFSQNGDPYLRLYHSEFAKALVECYKEFDDLAESVKKNFKKTSSNWEIGCIYSYMQRYPEEANRILSKLPKGMLNTISSQTGFQHLLREIFIKTKYFDHRCYKIYTTDIPYKIMTTLNEISVKQINNKINKWQSLWDISFFLKTLSCSFYKYYNQIDVSILEDKISRCDYPLQIVYLLKTAIETKYNRANTLHLKNFILNKIVEKWNDLDKISSFMEYFQNYCRKDFKKMKLDFLKEKIVSCPHLHSIVILLSYLQSLGRRRSVKKLIEDMGIGVIEDKMKACHDLQMIDDLLSVLSAISSVIVYSIRPIVFLEFVIRMDLGECISLINILHRNYYDINRVIKKSALNMLKTKISRSSNNVEITALLKALKVARFKYINAIERFITQRKILKNMNLDIILDVCSQIAPKNVNEIEFQLFKGKLPRTVDLFKAMVLTKTLLFTKYKNLDKIEDHVKKISRKQGYYNDTVRVFTILRALHAEIGNRKLRNVNPGMDWLRPLEPMDTYIHKNITEEVEKERQKDLDYYFKHIDSLHSPWAVKFLLHLLRNRGIYPDIIEYIQEIKGDEWLKQVIS